MKKTIAMKELGKSPKKEHLKLVHPFLNQEFRILEKKEVNSEKVFKELFGEETKVELWKLRAIYEVQN